MKTFWQILYAIGYITLIGPPRAIHIKHSADANDSELAGKPLWFVIGVEYLFRAGFFLIIATLTESTLGDTAFERYQFDILFVVLIVAGGLHCLAYLVCFSNPSSLQRAERIYRFARNVCYSVVPACCFAGIVNAIYLYNPQWIEQRMVGLSFWAIWALTAVIGLAEAALVKRDPRGMGKRFHSVIEQVD